MEKAFKINNIPKMQKATINDHTPILVVITVKFWIVKYTVNPFTRKFPASVSMPYAINEEYKINAGLVNNPTI